MPRRHTPVQSSASLRRFCYPTADASFLFPTSPQALPPPVAAPLSAKKSPDHQENGWHTTGFIRRRGIGFHTGIENFFCGVRPHFTQIHAPLIAGFGMVITGFAINRCAFYRQHPENTVFLTSDRQFRHRSPGVPADTGNGHFGSVCMAVFLLIATSTRNSVSSSSGRPIMMILSTRKASSPEPPSPDIHLKTVSLRVNARRQINHPGRHRRRVTHNLYPSAPVIEFFAHGLFSCLAQRGVHKGFQAVGIFQCIQPVIDYLYLCGERTVRRPDMECDGARRRNFIIRGAEKMSDRHGSTCPCFHRSTARCSGQVQTDGSRSHDAHKGRKHFLAYSSPI